MQAVDKTARGPSRVRADPDRDEVLLDLDGHAIVEHEAFAQPVFVPELLLIVDNPTMELEHLFKAVVSEERGGFFAPNASGAVHEDRLVPVLLECFHVGGKFPEKLDVTGQCALEFASR